jgi:hypothetical protein
MQRRIRLDAGYAAIEGYKIPALARAGISVATDAEIVLFCRSGFTDGLKKAAVERGDVTLVDLPQLVAEL